MAFQRHLTAIALVATLCATGPGPGPREHRETFEDAAVGSAAPGFSPEVGRWAVVALPEGGKAFAQTGESDAPVFNLALTTDAKFQDVDMTVRLRAVDGRNDQGGGLVWRAADARNYYVARFNPLEENFRVYKVVNGKRTQLATAEAKRTEGWRTLRVVMRRDHIACELDGRRLLDVRDATISDRGMIGLWTKSDARTQFDDFTWTAVE